MTARAPSPAPGWMSGAVLGNPGDQSWTPFWRSGDCPWPRVFGLGPAGHHVAELVEHVGQEPGRSRDLRGCGRAHVPWRRPGNRRPSPPSCPHCGRPDTRPTLRRSRLPHRPRPAGPRGSQQPARRRRPALMPQPGSLPQPGWLPLLSLPVRWSRRSTTWSIPPWRSFRGRRGPRACLLARWMRSGTCQLPRRERLSGRFVSAFGTARQSVATARERRAGEDVPRASFRIDRSMRVTVRS